MTDEPTETDLLADLRARVKAMPVDTVPGAHVRDAVLALIDDTTRPC